MTPVMNLTLVGFSEVTAYRAITLEPSLGVSKMTPNINSHSADGDAGVSVVMPDNDLTHAELYVSLQMDLRERTTQRYSRNSETHYCSLA